MGILFDVAPVERALAPLLAHIYPSTDLTPTSRITSLARRAARTSTLSALVDDFDATIDAIALLESTLAGLMLGLKQRRAMIKTTLAPITGLPIETLQEIFIIVTVNDPTSKAPIIISHVSSHWRAVVTGIKELWTTICHPGMLHKCAERSGDLRLHFTPAPAAHWPDDLEITAAEASRVSTLSSRLSVNVGGEGFGGRPKSFTSSLARHARLLSVDRVEISGPDHIVEDTFAAQAFDLTDLERSALRTISKTQLVEVAISYVSVSTCDSWLSSLSRNAPLLSRVKLATIFADELSRDEDNEYRIYEAYQVEPPPCCDRLESIAIVGCCKGVLVPILTGWAMPKLVSLALDLRETPGQLDWSSPNETIHEALLDFLSSPATANLETLDLTWDDFFIDGLVNFLKPRDGMTVYHIPRLRALRLCFPKEDLDEYRPLIIDTFKSRSERIPGSMLSRQLTVVESCLPEDSTNTFQYHALQCVLTPVE